MSVHIRTATPADALIVATLLADLGYPQDPAELPERIATLADTASDALLVAEVDGRVAGVASLHVTPFFNEGRGRLTSLVVDPALRGLGVGGELLRAVEAAARVRGCSAIELTSAAHREQAHRFYTAAGYDVVPHRFRKALDG
jgi:ribosomal protein S18 acetylase RimI-like enzyme